MLRPSIMKVLISMRVLHYTLLTLLLLPLTGPGVARAERASLVIDADTGAVLHANGANLPSFPASLTKLMTGYLMLEAVSHGRLRLDDTLIVSKAAVRQPPKKLGLRRGREISVEKILLATLVYSANDAAVVGAEAVAGSERAFVDMMNERAYDLGMFETRFNNATGLPDERQITTARDLVVLARALLNDFGYRHLMARRAFRFRGKRLRSSSSFLRQYEGLELGKTGFTCKAGYNLLASVERRERRLIGISLGNASARQRDRMLAKLFERALSSGDEQELEFDIDELWQAPDQGGSGSLNKKVLARTCLGRKRRASRSAAPQSSG